MWQWTPCSLPQEARGDHPPRPPHLPPACRARTWSQPPVARWVRERAAGQQGQQVRSALYSCTLSLEARLCVCRALRCHVCVCGRCASCAGGTSTEGMFVCLCDSQPTHLTSSLAVNCRPTHWLGAHVLRARQGGGEGHQTLHAHRTGWAWGAGGHEDCDPYRYPRCGGNRGWVMPVCVGMVDACVCRDG